MIYNEGKYNYHWETKKLAELGEFSRGVSKHRPRNDERLFEGGGYPLVQTGDVKDADLYITKHTQEYGEFGLKQSKLWKENTLCITIAANIAETALLSYPMCFPDSVVGFNADPDMTTEEFMYYIFEYIRTSIQNSASGSIQDNINIDYLTSLEFKIPKKNYQDKIVSLLSDIDKKIINNRKINDNLEKQLASTFDYYLSQANDNGAMVWSSSMQKKFPSTWEIADIKEVCDIIDCLHSKKPDYCYESDDYYLLGLDNISKEGYIVSNPRYYITEGDYKVWTSKIELMENDFVITNAGRAGDIGKVPQGVKCAIGRNITAVRPRQINPYYLRQFFKSKYFKIQVTKNLDSGSFFSSFNVKSIRELEIPIPDDSTMSRLCTIFTPIITEIERNVEEIEKLSSYREWLLPMLMNGQATISD